MKVKRRKGNSSPIRLVFIFIISFLWCQQVDGQDHYVVELDFVTNYKYIIQFPSLENRYHVRVNSSRTRNDVDYKISVVLERLSISSQNSASILVENTDTHLIWNTNVDYTNTNYDDINSRHIVDGENFVNITNQGGSWSDLDEAQLIVTIYFESESCAGCPIETFCCERGKECSGGPPIDLSSDGDGEDENKMDIFNVFGPNTVTGSPIGHQPNARCLNMETRCDSHPNCAFNCNADESDEICNPSGCGQTCFWNMSFLWTALLAVVFFIMAPTVVVFLICYHRQLTVVSRRQQSRGSDVVTVSSPSNDLPPNYEELLSSEEAPPCFCCAIAAASNSASNSTTNESNDVEEGGGHNNPGFLPDDSMTNYKTICSCRTSTDTNKVDQVPKINQESAPTTPQNNNIISHPRNATVANNIDSNV